VHPRRLSDTSHRWELSVRLYGVRARPGYRRDYVTQQSSSSTSSSSGSSADASPSPWGSSPTSCSSSSMPLRSIDPVREGIIGACESIDREALTTGCCNVEAEERLDLPDPSPSCTCAAGLPLAVARRLAVTRPRRAQGLWGGRRGRGRRQCQKAAPPARNARPAAAVTMVMDGDGPVRSDCLASSTCRDGGERGGGGKGEGGGGGGGGGEVRPRTL